MDLLNTLYEGVKWFFVAFFIKYVFFHWLADRTIERFKVLLDKTPRREAILAHFMEAHGSKIAQCQTKSCEGAYV